MCYFQLFGAESVVLAVPLPALFNDVRWKRWCTADEWVEVSVHLVPLVLIDFMLRPNGFVSEKGVFLFR